MQQSFFIINNTAEDFIGVMKLYVWLLVAYMAFLILLLW